MPWYRQPWPWFLISLPAISVIGCGITIWLAVRSADGVVAADYYKRGLAINAELSRSRRAADLGLTAEVSVTGFESGDRVRLVLLGERALPADSTLRLTFFHPSRAGADRTVILGRAASEAQRAEYAGQFDAGAAATPPVAWEVSIEAPTWRLDGQISARAGQHFRLAAAQ